MYPAVKHAEPSAPPDQAEASAPPMSEHMAQVCMLAHPAPCYTHVPLKKTGEH